jgi:hypothetical protein
VGRLLDGEKMLALCREFAISRKTGYKIFDRYILGDAAPPRNFKGCWFCLESLFFSLTGFRDFLKIVLRANLVVRF